MAEPRDDPGTRDESVWDYTGLVAESFDLWFGTEPFPDQEFYARRISEGPGRALEIGSGTGRLLIPFLRDGLDVEGLDASAEMLAICRRKAARLSLAPVLHEQRMQALDLPTRYATIYIPQCSFQILAAPGEGRATLERMRRHLRPGGRLFVSLELARFDPEAGAEWIRRRHGALERDGTLVSIFDRSRYDAVEQILHRELRYVAERGGRSEVVLTQALREQYYTPPEFQLLLEQAGFVDVEVHGDHREEPLDERHRVAVFGATRARESG